MQSSSLPLGLQPSKIKDYLKQCDHFDPDIRNMGLRDLTTALQSFDGLLEENLQNHVRDKVLSMLESNSSNVQTMAITCLSSLVKKVSFEQVSQIIDKLFSLLLRSQSEEMNSMVYVMTLKSTINSCSHKIADDLIPKLLQTLSLDSDHLSAGLELLIETLKHSGSSIYLSQIEAISQQLLPLLDVKRENIIKLVILTMSHLVNYMSDSTFSTLLSTLIAKLRDTESVKNTYISLSSVISRSYCIRFSEYLPEIIPSLLFICTPYQSPLSLSLSQSLSTSTSNSNYLPLNSSSHISISKDQIYTLTLLMKAFESLFSHYASFLPSYLSDILGLCLFYLSYDPNYCSDQDMNDIILDTDDWNEEDNNDITLPLEYLEDQQMEIDDCGSSLLRRSCVNTLQSYIKSDIFISQMLTPSPSISSSIFSILLSNLLSRFEERHCLVQYEIIECTISLIDRCKDSLSPSLSSLLSQYIDLIYQSVEQQFKKNSCDNLNSLLSLLKHLMIACPNSLSPYLSSILPTLLSYLHHPTNEIIYSSLSTLHSLILTHTPSLFLKFLDQIYQEIISCLLNSRNLIIIEDLKLISDLCPLLLSPSILSLSQSDHIDHNSFTLLSPSQFSNLFAAILSPLHNKTHNIDRDVLLSSLSTLGVFAHTFSPLLKEEIPSILSIFTHYLNIPDTRLCTLSVLSFIASPNHGYYLDFSSHLSTFIQSFFSILAKSNHITSQASLITLYHLLSVSLDSLSSNILNDIVENLSLYLKVSDINLSPYIVSILSLLLCHHSSLSSLIIDIILPLIYKLLVSDSLLDNSVSSIQSLISQISPIYVSHPSPLFLSLSSLISPSLSSSSLFSIAICLSSLAYNEVITQKIVQYCIETILGEQSIDCQKQVCLYILADLGSHFNLSKYISLSIFIKVFNISSPSLSMTVSQSLGSFLLSSPSILSTFLSLFSVTSPYLYPLASSLHIFLSSVIHQPNLIKEISPSLNEVCRVCMDFLDTQDEDLRYLCSECLGLCVSMEWQNKIEWLVSTLSSTPLSSIYIRSALIHAYSSVLLYCRKEKPSKDLSITSISSSSTNLDSSSHHHLSSLSSVSLHDQLTSQTYLFSINPCIPSVPSVPFNHSSLSSRFVDNSHFSSPSSRYVGNSYQLLKTTLPSFLLLSDPNLLVQRESFLLIDRLVHLDFDFLQGFLCQEIIMNKIFKGLVFQPHLVKVMEFGQKFQIDEGLPLRKSVYSLCLSLLSLPLSLHLTTSISLSSLLSHLMMGLSDPSDEIILLTLKTIRFYHKSYPQTLFEHISSFMTSLRKTIIQNINELTIEPERSQRVISACLSLMIELYHSSISTDPAVVYLYKQLSKTVSISAIFQEEVKKYQKSKDN